MPLGNVSVDNSIEIFHTGDEYYNALWSDIRHAKYQILMEIYIMEPDEISQRTLDELTAASERGVSVTLIVDGLGSSKMSYSNFNNLRRAGGIVLKYNQYSISRILDTFFLKRKMPWIFAYRNHKKVCVIDDKIGFTGGMNMTGEYCSNAITGGINKFRDTHCRLQGNVIKFLKESIYYSVLDIDPIIPTNTENNSSNLDLDNPNAVINGTITSESMLDQSLKNKTNEININNKQQYNNINNRKLSKFHNELGLEKNRNSTILTQFTEDEDDDSDTELESVLMDGEWIEHDEHDQQHNHNHPDRHNRHLHDFKHNYDVVTVIDPNENHNINNNGDDSTNRNNEKNRAISGIDSNGQMENQGNFGYRQKEFATSMLPAFLQPFQHYSVQNYLRQSWQRVRNPNNRNEDNYINTLENENRDQTGVGNRNKFGTIFGSDISDNIHNSSSSRSSGSRSRNHDPLYSERIKILASTPRLSVKEWLDLNKMNTIANVRPFGIEYEYEFKKEETKNNNNGESKLKLEIQQDLLEKQQRLELERLEGVDTNSDTNSNTNTNASTTKTNESSQDLSTQPWEKGYTVPQERSGLLTSNEVQTSTLEASQLSKLMNEAKLAENPQLTLADVKARIQQMTQLDENGESQLDFESQSELNKLQNGENGILSNVLSSSVDQSLRKDSEKNENKQMNSGEEQVGKRGVPLGNYLQQHGNKFSENTDVNNTDNNEDKKCYIQVLESYRDKRMRFIQKALRDSIDNAVSHVFITNPYFLPPRYLKKSLINAAKRGVDVRIITCVS